MPHSPSKAANSAVPRLTQLAFDRAIVLFDHKDLLPPAAHSIIISHSNKMFETLRRKGKLNRRHMKKILALGRFRMNKISLLDVEMKQTDLKLCSRHNLVSLQIPDLDCFRNREKIHIPEVLKAVLNQTSCQQLRHLDLTGDQKLNVTWPTYIAKTLPSLESLIFANRRTNDQTCALLGSKLPQLRFLNLSSTGIKDISWISNLRNLEVLVMFGLDIERGDIETLEPLTKLRVLDISRLDLAMAPETHLNLARGIYNKSVEAIENRTATPWPELRSLDIAGLCFTQQGTDQALVFAQKIIEAHPKLEQLNLLDTPLDQVVVEVPGRSCKVINQCPNPSIIPILSHYMQFFDRRMVLWFNLKVASDMLRDRVFDQLPLEQKGVFFRVVCWIIEHWLHDQEIIKVAVECIVELRHNGRLNQLSAEGRKQIIECCLTIVYKYPDYRLQNNVWMILAKQNLLSTDKKTLVHLCETAFNVLSCDNDIDVVRNIINALQTAMRNLCRQFEEVYAEHVAALVKYIDILLGHDEIDAVTISKMIGMLTSSIVYRPSMNHAFLEAGYETMFNVLSKFDEDSSVCSDTLDLLSISSSFEGASLDPLRESEKISALIFFLETVNIEGSFFAGITLANLMKDPEVGWENEQQRQEVSEKLLRAVSEYPDSPREFFVMYSSLDWMNPILRNSNSNGAVLLILWTLLHLLQTEGQVDVGLTSYTELVFSSGIHPIVQEMADGHSQHLDDLDNRVIRLAKQIIDFIAANDH